MYILGGNVWNLNTNLDFLNPVLLGFTYVSALFIKWARSFLSVLLSSNFQQNQLLKLNVLIF